MNELSTIGKRIADLRFQKRLTQAELAKKLGIATSTLGMYEQNKREPNIPMMKELATFFNVSVDYLIGYDKAKPNKKGNIVSTLYLNVKYLAMTQKVSLSQLERELGFGNGTISSWKKSAPTSDKLEKVADYFPMVANPLMILIEI